MEVDFVTLGTASEKLDVPAPTLRGWADKLEEMGIHFLERNDRNERVFYDLDFEIFKFMKEQKEIYGRKTTTTNLAHVVGDQFECRSLEDRPDLAVYKPPKPELSTADIEVLMSNSLFKEFLDRVKEETAAAVKESVKQEFSEEFERDREQRRQAEERRAAQTDQMLSELRELREYQRLPALKKLFYKPKNNNE